MIRSISRVSGTPCVEWWDDVPFLKDHPEISFDPRLTVLVGPNGSGKSTILKAIARLLHAEQGGVQKVTQTSMSELKRSTHDSEGQFCYESITGLSVDHDGSPLYYMNPEETPGLMGGSFDDDFMMEGVNSIFSRRRSSGEVLMGRLSMPLKAMVGMEKFQKVDLRRLPKEVRGSLKGSGKKEKPSILLDEPTRSLEPDKEIALWGRVLESTDCGRCQVIVATHSVVPLLLSHRFGESGTLLELEDGYIAKTQTALQRLSRLESDESSEKA